ncbi:DUF1631 family protein [Duganella violaceipulchra]|uniref:DUF1631 domain-containing protein n=1 Tax=Duganella violaceipulchra TaxID=2849652 RepID=A0AA41H4L8_9BURK|nr:DUF1631 family protein [Duganella violaceicalia]MBV6319620.1 DUF1631 domain-containing protein [Duganella violaceicalia]MCP2006568.1 hypothetical protein [Duganella violaceicalia]
MVATSTTPALPKKTVSPRHALLEELIGIATRHASDQYLDLATRLAGALIDATGGDPRTMQQRIRAGNQLRNRNFAFLHLASSTLEKALRREIAELSPALKGKVREAEQPLSLVPFEEMDNKVALSGVSKPFESLYSDQLQTLNVRLAFLLDRDILRVSQNPFRPDVFLVALQQAWTEFDTEADAAPLLQPLIKPGMFIELGPMLDALNLALQSKGVLPGSVDGHKGRKADKAKAAAPSRVRGNQAALAQQLRQFFASSDVEGSAAGAIVDNIADGLMHGVDLSIPDLPMSALNSGAAWVPNAAAQGDAGAGQSGPKVAAAGGVMGAHGAAPAAAHGVMALAQGVQGGVLMAPGFAAGLAGAPAVAAGGFAPAGGVWVQGAAQGLLPDSISNEDAQRLSQIGAKQPLLAYLAQLQKAVPYESIGTLGAVAGYATGPVPSSTAAVDAAPAAGGNVFYLPNIKASMPQGSLSRTDESTIDLLSAIFDTVFQDQNISQEIRDLIRFLQIPVLKAALVDKNFFFQEAHPARRLIDLLSRMGWEQRKGPEDPLFQAMQRSVDRVGRDYDHELSVFTEAVNELEASIQAEERAAATAIAEPIAAALKQERMAESTKLAKNAVALRIGTGEVIAVVEAFLEQRWVSVLTIAYSIEDDKPGAVNNATKTMDDLIWSVRPKLNADERKQLIAKLPVLLTTLNKWLDIIKWQDADRLQFFAELAECHASIVRAPLEMSPERQLEISMQVAQQAAERRLELQAKADAAAKAEAEARAQQQPDPEEEDAAIEVDSLTRGMWLEFEQEDGGSRKVKLAWISPLRTLYIFSTAARQEAFSMSGEQLAKRFLEQTVQVVRSEGVVAVALSQALARSADNDASIDPPASAFG